MRVLELDDLVLGGLVLGDLVLGDLALVLDGQGLERLQHLVQELSLLCQQ